MAEGELREEVRGKAGNALYIGPKSGDIETTPAIQQLTRGNIVSNRRNSVRNDTLHSGIDACHFHGKDEGTQKVNQWHYDTWFTNHCGLTPKFCQYPGRSFERRGNWWDSRKLHLWFVHRDRPLPKDQVKPGNHPRRLRDITDKETVNYNQQGLP